MNHSEVHFSTDIQSDDNKINANFCDQCKNDAVIFDVASHEFVCSSCGYVSNKESFDDDRSFVSSGYEDKARTGMPQSLAMPHKGLSTLIGVGDVDAKGKALEPSQRLDIQRLRTWNNRTQLNDSISRNLEKALKYLNNFGDKLYLNKAVIEGAAYIYRKAANKKLAKGRSTIGLVGASLYAACRESETPKTIMDVAMVCNLQNKDIMTHYKLLLKELSLNVPMSKGTDYITLISNRLNLSEKTKREALRINSIIEQKNMSIGKNPRAVAGAIIYLSSQICNEFVRQVEICQVADISTVSLRKRCKEIKEETS